MYAETGLLYPYFQNPSQESYHLGDLYQSQKPNGPMSNLVETSSLSDYDLGGEGDLFKAPAPMIEEPLVELDPMTAAISMMSCGEEVMSPQALKVAEALQNEQFFNDVFYECQKDFVGNASIETPESEFLDNKIQCIDLDGSQMAGEKLLLEGPVQKSVSSECLRSMEGNDGPAGKPNFMDFSTVDYQAAYGMRRAFSEGDIKALGVGHVSVHSPLERITCNIEERKQKLSRYRNKKQKRNFGRKIKYACRKALADSQPRIRGRFAKTEELEIPKKQ